MNVNDYQHEYSGKNEYLLYFCQNPLRRWKYIDFEQHFSVLPNILSKKRAVAAYMQSLYQIKDNKKTPGDVKERIDALLNDLSSTTNSSTNSSITYHINQGPSSVCYSGNNISNASPNIAAEGSNNEIATVGNKRPFADTESEQNAPARPIDRIFSESPILTLNLAPTSAEFRKSVYAYGVKVLSKEFLIADNFNLQLLLNSFVPKTLGEKLDVMSAKLIMSVDLNNAIEVSALKLSLSRIVDTVNSKISSLFRQYLDNPFWEELKNVNITMCTGMSEASKTLYQEMIRKGTINGKINKKQLRIAISKEKTSFLESDQLDSLQLLDIIDLLAKHCTSDPAICSDNTESELTSYRKCAKILDEILDSTMINMLDGEIACKASKSIAKSHEKMYGSSIPLNNGFGRRIDLILATKNVELSTNEWKRLKTPSNKCLQQQVKNIRMNKAILTHLLNLPFDEAVNDNIFTVGMDWTGPLGYMFGVSKVKDVYVAETISTLVIPTYIDELPLFEETLNHLYAWRNYHLNLKDIMLPALRKYEQEMFFSSVLGTPVPVDVSSSPNIYLTPSRRRRSQAPANIDLDVEDLDDDDDEQ